MWLPKLDMSRPDRLLPVRVVAPRDRVALGLDLPVMPGKPPPSPVVRARELQAALEKSGREPAEANGLPPWAFHRLKRATWPSINCVEGSGGGPRRHKPCAAAVARGSPPGAFVGAGGGGTGAPAGRGPVDVSRFRADEGHPVSVPAEAREARQVLLAHASLVAATCQPLARGRRGPAHHARRRTRRRAPGSWRP